MNIMNHMHDIVPFRIGQKVRIKPDPFRDKYWSGEWVVVGIVWEYQKGNGSVNIWIASHHDIEHGFGATDGFSVDDLEPVF